MGLFDNKKDDTKKEAVLTDFSFLSRNGIPLFESTRSLLYEAESHYRNEEFQLCDDILAVVVKHIKRNKTLGTLVLKHTDITSEIHRNGKVTITPTRDTNTTLNEE